MDINNEYGCLAIHQSLLVILQQFHDFCKENDITYSVSWGTALGAVRHKGFIPWDDDIDVNITHEQYYKLRECIKKSDLLMLEEEIDATGWIPRITQKNREKVDGYFPTIDLFFIDNVPDNALLRKLHLFEMMFLQGMLKKNLVWNKGNIALKVGNLTAFLFGRLFTQKFKYKWFHWAMTRYNGKATKLKASYNTDFIDMRKFYSMKEGVVEIPFETIKVYLVEDYHQLLVSEFGLDYMTPPESKKPKHIQ